MSEKFLRESVTEAPVKSGNRWRVIVARPGQGSSGKYSAEMFRRDGHKIIAPGGQSFINHDDSRNPKDMIGVYPEGSFWSEDDQAVVSELEVFSHWKQFVEEVGPHCGISLYALGEADEDGNVTAIIEDRLNGADLVARPGLVGSGLAEKLYESAKAHVSENAPSAEVVEDHGKENNNMAYSDEQISALIAAVESLVSAQTAKAEKAVEADVIETAVTEARKAVRTQFQAIEDADLLPSQKAELLEAAEAGQDVSGRIAKAVEIKAEALAAAKAEESHDETPGRVFGERKAESALDLGKVFG